MQDNLTTEHALSRTEGEFTKKVEEYSASLPSAAFLGVAAAAMGVSLLCQVTGKGKWGNFIAQWVPTWLMIGLYNKLVKVEGHSQTDRESQTNRKPPRTGASTPLKDFINYRVEVVQPTDTLQQVAQKMRYLDVGSMPVCEGQQLLGVVTDRDITIRATAEGYDATKTPVRDVMTAEVVYCFENQDVQEAAKVMQEHQIRRIFVVNANRELVGITSLGELATITGDQPLVGAALERISEPSESRPN